jgi:hypothetical protein
MNWTLEGQTFIANTLISIFGTKELLAVFTLLMVSLLLIFGGVGGDIIFIIVLFTGILLVAPAAYGGIELFPVGNVFFLIILIIGGFIIGTAIWRAFRNA